MKSMLESREVGRDTSSSFFFPIRLRGFGGEQAEQKLEEEEDKEKKRIS